MQEPGKFLLVTRNGGNVTVLSKMLSDEAQRLLTLVSLSNFGFDVLRFLCNNLLEFRVKTARTIPSGWRNETEYDVFKDDRNSAGQVQFAELVKPHC